MSNQRGDFALGQTVRVAFNTSDSDGNGATLAGSTACVIRDGGSTPITAGVTISVDVPINGVPQVGKHRIVVDTANAANFPKGSDYEVVLTAGTSAGANLAGQVIGEFSIENRSDSRAIVEDGQNLTRPQAIGMTAAGAVAQLTGKLTGNYVLRGAGNPGVTRATATITEDGREDVVLVPRA